ncbi:MAG: aquaporin [Balneolaceae bacterium]
MKKYVVEFIGTFFLMFAIITAVANAGALAPLAIGAALMVMIYAGGPISGAHYNPAVTLAVWIRGKCETKDIAGYVIAQLAASAIAATVATSLLGIPMGSGMEVEVVPALTAEFLGTFALCFVILNVATADRSAGNSYFGLAIGFTVTAMAFTLGGISGGAFNPAVVVGGSLAGLLSWSNLWIYLVANLVAGAVAAFAFKFVDSE